VVLLTGCAEVTSPRARILVVEDDDGLADEIVAELQEHGFDVARERNAPDALERVATNQFNLLILDRMLGSSDGLSVIESLRSQRNMMPILVVSALNAVGDRIHGLTVGGDDYLTKPFALGELAARVEALLRRPGSLLRETVLRAGPLEMDLIDKTVRRGTREISLLPREFRLLEYLMRRSNQIVTREMLLKDIWRYHFIPKTNLVDVHVGKLRRKIDAPDETILLQLVRSVGFMLRIHD
jgi:two-component system, OmpR family, response regulator